MVALGGGVKYDVERELKMLCGDLGQVFEYWMICLTGVNLLGVDDLEQVLIVLEDMLDLSESFCGIYRF